MAIFDRFRRMQTETPEPAAMPMVLPGVNQRLMISRGGGDPVPTRVDDENDEQIIVAWPDIALEGGESVIITWEGDDGWYSLDTTVAGTTERALVPTISLDKRGRLRRYDDRRSDLRRRVAVPLELRVLVARVVKPGNVLSTQTVELAPNAIRFSTNAPFAPGDLIEARISLGDGDAVSARIKIIRIDAVSGAWRQTATAVFEEMLRSDRSRLVGFIESGAGRRATPDL